ncbi:hypothetical protein LSH36_1413g00010 [Paralvinella palmiformis]|uniref:SWIM-type domain-containing protein n=1 Tax=Paralvinella palmiformis TaxID=53620 RepID=A0AAD9MQD0_9ANNE|nr:hypothetical protein LSH36_1413g00010 [Paralvinella palmiformis]
MQDAKAAIVQSTNGTKLLEMLTLEKVIHISASYIFGIKVLSSTTGCHIEGWCYRSMKKNLEPHHVSVEPGSQVVSLTSPGDTDCQAPSVISASCSKGVGGSCGHVAGLLYQVAKFKMMKLRAISEDVAKTWHQPKGEKIAGDEV